jgi:hypothetical protein
MFPPSCIGRNQLTPRFTAIVKILNVDYPTPEDLLLVYTEYFRALLRSRKMDENLCKQFAGLFVEVFAGIKRTFSVD